MLNYNESIKLTKIFTDLRKAESEYKAISKNALILEKLRTKNE